MRNIMLAIAAMAFATLAPFAVAAEGQGDNAEKQPTMAELGNKINGLSSQVARLEATVGTLRTELGTLATTVGTLSSTVTANHTTIVGKFAQQTAVVMTVPTSTDGSGNARYHLVGDSTIAGFPAGTVAANGQFTDRTLPAGTYLFELQQPYSDNVLCNGSVSRTHLRWGVDNNADALRHKAVCPRLFMVVAGTPIRRLNDGFGIYTFTAPTVFRMQHRFPTGLTFTDDKPLGSYTGAVRITKLK